MSPASSPRLLRGGPRLGRRAFLWVLVPMLVAALGAGVLGAAFVGQAQASARATIAAVDQTLRPALNIRLAQAQSTEQGSGKPGASAPAPAPPRAATARQNASPVDAVATPSQAGPVRGSISAPMIVEKQKDSRLLLAIILVLALATTMTAATSFYLYRLRHPLAADRVADTKQAGGAARVLDRQIDALAGGLQEHAQSQNEALALIGTALAQSDEKISALQDTSVALHRALDQRDAEIRRLQQGYDVELFRRFIARFLRVRQALDDLVDGGNATPQAVHQISRLLDDAFDECGVERFAPAAGSDYRTAQGVADNPKVVKTSISGDAFKIAEVLEPGYRFRGNGKNEIIVPARVSIYVA